MEPLDPNLLDKICTVLKAHGATRFECSQFRIAFDVPMEEEEEERVSTDVRGFQAQATSDDDEEVDDDDVEARLSKFHRAALRGTMPRLNPTKKG